MKPFYLLLSLVFLFSCTVDDGTSNIFEINGFVPIYGNIEDYTTISIESPQQLEVAGRIFYLNEYLYIVESGKGVHIFNNSNPENPINESFLAVPGCFNVAVKGNYFYVNNYTDLIVIDMTDEQNPQVVQRFENQIGSMNDFISFPEEGYYLCPDENRIVTGWEQGTFFSNQCYEIQ